MVKMLFSPQNVFVNRALFVIFKNISIQTNEEIFLIETADNGLYYCHKLHACEFEMV